MLACLFALSACSDSITYRYRLTVEVLADGVVHSGSSVLEVSHSRLFNMNGGGYTEGAGIAKGEAVAVDLGARGVVFAILSYRNRGSDPSYFAEYVFGARNSDGSVRNNTLAELRDVNFSGSKGSRELPPAYWPEMVRFRNLADPASVERVNPQNLAASFGQGVKVLRVTAEITSDKITTEITKMLPWLVFGFPETRLKTGSQGKPLSKVTPDYLLNYMDFKRPVK